MKNSWTGSDEHLKQAAEASKLGALKQKKNRKKRIGKYNKNPKLCKHCGNVLSYDERYKTFCNSSCSASFTNKGKKKSLNERIKISRSLGGSGDYENNGIKKRKRKVYTLYPHVCKFCGIEYKSKKRIQKYCSQECSNKRPKTEEEKEKNRQAQLKLVKEGKHQGWKSRTKEPSYAEQYFIDLFNKEGIKGWIREYKVDKYFIDFAFLEMKIALEIDGKQHRLNEERIERDRKKDKVLKENGWKVIRIDWYNPVNDVNKKKLYNQIGKLIENI